MPVDTADTGSTPGLQWSREQLLAEISALLTPHPIITALQWSREQLLAEMRQAQCRHNLSDRFNGAASSCSRKFWGTIQKGRRSRGLQWSREQLLAEIF